MTVSDLFGEVEGIFFDGTDFQLLQKAKRVFSLIAQLSQKATRYVNISSLHDF